MWYNDYNYIINNRYFNSIINQFKVTSCNLFEVYRVDILSKDNLESLLIKFNLNPSLNCDSELDIKIKSKLLTDMFNIIALVPFIYNEKIQIINKEIIYKDSKMLMKLYVNLIDFL